MGKNNDQYYFEVFSRCASLGLGSARHLQSVLRDFDPGMLDAELQTMRCIESKADRFRQGMATRLHREFLPPFDREDVWEIANRISSIVGCANSVLQCIYMYHISTIRPEASEFSVLTVRCCSEVAAMLEDFPAFRKKQKEIYAHIAMLHSIKTDGDMLYLRTMHDLYGRKADPIVLAAWDHVFDSMKQCLEACKNVGDTVERILIKNT